MADFEFESLLTPISEGAPCGPDLEMEGDGPYWMFDARKQDVLPESYFEFDRGQVNFEAEIATLAGISRRSADLRILTIFAKVEILNRDLVNFQRCISAIAALLEQRWDDVHPQPMDGDVSLRAIQLQSLDDAAHTIYPMQFAPLFKTRRFGQVTFRQHLLVERQVQPRKTLHHDDDGGVTIEEEKIPASADLRGAINDVDLPELVAVRDVAGRLVAALGAIERHFDEKSGKIGVVRLKELGPLAAALHRFLDECVGLRDPAQATLSAAPAADAPEAEADDGGAPRPVNASAVASLDEAMRAIQAASLYFARREASSPARLWLAQARALAGKSFYDALRALVPEYASQATVSLARELPLTLPVERLSELLDEEMSQSGDEPEQVGEAGDDSGAANDGSESAGDTDDSAAAESAEPAPEPAPTPPAPVQKTFRAADRLEAIRLIEVAATYIRGADPSSPLPMLLDQARAGAGRDFISLLREVLPPSALRID